MVEASSTWRERGEMVVSYIVRAEACAVLVLVLTSSAPGQCRSEERGGESNCLDSVAARVGERTPITIELRSGAIVRGDAFKTDGESVWLRNVTEEDSAGSEISMRMEEVLAIGFRGDGRKIGSWAGGGLVLGLVAGSVAAVVTHDDPGPQSSDAWNWDLSPFLYMIGGGVLGWAVGSAIPVTDDEEVRVLCP